MFKLDTLEDKFSASMDHIENMLYMKTTSKQTTTQLQELEGLRIEND